MIALVLAGCGGAAAPPAKKGYHWDSESTLSIFMKKKVNAPFSKLSFFLFQTEESDETALKATAGALLAATNELSQWAEPPGDSPQARQVFFEYAAAMKVDASQLVSAVDAGNREDAVRRFEKVREKCDSCHHFFRFGQ